MHRIIPRKSLPARRKPSALANFVALQIAFSLIAIRTKLLVTDLGTCGQGHKMFACTVCTGRAGQCQSDPKCNDGIRCTGGCTNL